MEPFLEGASASLVLDSAEAVLLEVAAPAPATEEEADGGGGFASKIARSLRVAVSATPFTHEACSKGKGADEVCFIRVGDNTT